MRKCPSYLKLHRERGWRRTPWERLCPCDCSIPAEISPSRMLTRAPDCFIMDWLVITLAANFISWLRKLVSFTNMAIIAGLISFQWAFPTIIMLFYYSVCLSELVNLILLDHLRFGELRLWPTRQHYRLQAWQKLIINPSVNISQPCAPLHNVPGI